MSQSKQITIAFDNISPDRIVSFKMEVVESTPGFNFIVQRPSTDNSKLCIEGKCDENFNIHALKEKVQTFNTRHMGSKIVVKPYQLYTVSPAISKLCIHHAKSSVNEKKISRALNDIEIFEFSMEQEDENHMKVTIQFTNQEETSKAFEKLQRSNVCGIDSEVEYSLEGMGFSNEARKIVCIGAKKTKGDSEVDKFLNRFKLKYSSNTNKGMPYVNLTFETTGEAKIALIYMVYINNVFDAIKIDFNRNQPKSHRIHVPHPIPIPAPYHHSIFIWSVSNEYTKEDLEQSLGCTVLSVKYFTVKNGTRCATLDVNSISDLQTLLRELNNSKIFGDNSEAEMNKPKRK